MVEGQSSRYTAKTEIEKYYFSSSARIYTDKISDFICICNMKSEGLVLQRLECIYDKIFIDEVQDLAGHDLDFLGLLFKSRSEIVAVGDNRQATYFTNHSSKHRHNKGIKIIDLFHQWEKKGFCKITQRNECFRSNQKICDFADGLYPNMSQTISKNYLNTGHDGVFLIERKSIKEYISKYEPKVLRYNKASDTENFPALNFGMSKGLTFDRVLIFPTKKVEKYLITGELNDLGDIAKFYVAITRARFSVAIACDKKTLSKTKVFQPNLFSLS